MTGKFLVPSNIPIRKLDDHRMLVKFLRIFIIILVANHSDSLLKIPVWKVRKLDDHWILMTCFKNFDPNSGGQPKYLTTQLQDFIQLLVIKLRLGIKKNYLGAKKIYLVSDKCGYRSPSCELGHKKSLSITNVGPFLSDGPLFCLRLIATNRRSNLL